MVEDLQQKIEEADELVGSGKVQKFPLGLIEPNDEDREDEESVGFFEDVGSNLVGAPISYNAVSQGWVTPIKNQASCGSCAAFAAAAVEETCYKKLMAKQAIFSEQWLLDCGYGYEGSNACNGAPLHAYATFSASKKKIVSGTKYPYRAALGSCPASVTSLIADNTFAVNNAYYTYSGTEDMLKTLVAERGAVGIAIWIPQLTLNQLYAYRGGVFNGCASGGPIVGGHAMAVVGYGSQSGQDYWLIKNSWGTGWGESGYLKLRRGVGACGIGGSLFVVDCARTSASVRDCAEGESCGEGGEEEGDETTTSGAGDD